MKRLSILGRAIDVDLGVASDAATLRDLWAPARAASEAITSAVREAEAARGVTPSCREGCAACCTHLVPISTLEAARLADAVAALPARERDATRARFGEAVRRLERAGLLDRKAPKGRAALTVAIEAGESAWDAVSARYRALGLACPLLVHRRCSLYDERPLVCREYLVATAPERCAGDGTEVVALPRPARMSEVLADATAAITGEAITSIPLVLALEWSAQHAASLDVSVDARAASGALGDALDAQEDP